MRSMLARPTWAGAALAGKIGWAGEGAGLAAAAGAGVGPGAGPGAGPSAGVLGAAPEDGMVWGGDAIVAGAAGAAGAGGGAAELGAEVAGEADGLACASAILRHMTKSGSARTRQSAGLSVLEFP